MLAVYGTAQVQAFQEVMNRRPVGVPRGRALSLANYLSSTLQPWHGDLARGRNTVQTIQSIGVMNQSVCVRSTPLRTLRPALALLALASAVACAAQVRRAVGPTVNTLGGLGFDVTVSGGMGRGTKDTVVALLANLGGGAMDNAQTPVLLEGMEDS